jgi:hypothetical protein
MSRSRVSLRGLVLALVVLAGAAGAEPSAEVKALQRAFTHLEQRHRADVTDLKNQLAELKSQMAELRAEGGDAAPAALPKPHLVLLGTESSSIRGNTFTRYRLGVENQALFSNELFAPAPHLPPCGRNTSSSRTWVDILDASGARRYGFCGFGAASDLGKLWFSVQAGKEPPAQVKIRIRDRERDLEVESNLVRIGGGAGR